MEKNEDTGRNESAGKEFNKAGNAYVKIRRVEEIKFQKDGRDICKEEPK